MIPQWRATHISHTKGLVSRCSKLFKTATYAPAVVAIRNLDPRLLAIKGIYVDEILKLSPIWIHMVLLQSSKCSEIQEVLDIYTEFLNLVDNAFSMAREDSFSIYSIGERQNLLWRTICQSREDSDDERTTHDEAGQMVQNKIQEVRRLIKLGRGVANQVDMARLSSAVAVLAIKLFRMLGRKLCITSRGYFGVVPPFAEGRDQIWAFLGLGTLLSYERHWNTHTRHDLRRDIGRLVFATLTGSCTGSWRDKVPKL
jgi:hypothetical protein